MTLLLLALCGRAAATEVGARPFGLGIVLGDPSGLSAKYYLSEQNALDFALAFDTYGNNDGWTYFHATWLVHPSVLTDTGDFEVPWHVGVGGYVVSDEFQSTRDRDRLGVRVPIGLDLNLHSVPLQFFGDVALRVDILPATEIDFDFGIGGRYYF